MEKKYLYISSLLLLLFTSCVRDVVLKLDPVPPVLVLNASVTPDQEVAAFLSRSWFLLDSIPEYELPDKDVHLNVYLNDVFRGAMQRSDNPSDTTEYKGQYRLPGCYARTGDRVKLEAEVAGFAPVSAETIIPEKTEIVSLDTIFYSNSYNLQLYVTLQDNPSERNYYRLVVERLIEFQKGDSVMWVSSLGDEYFRDKVYGDHISVDPHMFSFFHPNLAYDDLVFQPDVPSLNDNGNSFSRGIFTDDLFNGKEYAVACSFTPNFSFVTDTLSATVHYDIHLLSVSEDYYNYLKVIRNFSIALGDAYTGDLLEPTATYSNVTDGFGVVTGYQKSTRRITMPLSSVPPGGWGW